METPEGSESKKTLPILSGGRADGTQDPGDEQTCGRPRINDQREAGRIQNQLRGRTYKVNPFDEIAAEEALRLKERHGGEVVVTSIGGGESMTEIRTALAMGAVDVARPIRNGPAQKIGTFVR